MRADGRVRWGRYSWTGWGRLGAFLDAHSVDLSEFDGMNDGKLIRAKTCRKVADVIEENLEDYRAALYLSDANADYAIEESNDDILLWRTCGGYRQH